MSFRSPRLALVFFLLLQALPAAAQTQPIDVTTSVEYTFGAALAFRAKITAAAPVARASLFYRAVGAPETVVLLSELSAGPPATATASQDLRARPLIPFAAVEYWWQVDLADVEPAEAAFFEEASGGDDFLARRKIRGWRGSLRARRNNTGPPARPLKTSAKVFGGVHRNRHGRARRIVTRRA